MRRSRPRRSSAAAAHNAASSAPTADGTTRCLCIAEKARWALDWHKVPYYESAWLPMLSNVGVIWHGGWQSGKADNGASVTRSALNKRSTLP